MAGLTDLTLAELCSTLAKKEASAVEVADAHLKKLEVYPIVGDTPTHLVSAALWLSAYSVGGESN